MMARLLTVSGDKFENETGVSYVQTGNVIKVKISEWNIDGSYDGENLKYKNSRNYYACPEIIQKLI